MVVFITLNDLLKLKGQMNDKLKKLQIEFLSNIENAENTLGIVKELSAYVNVKPNFFKELELTDTALKEALRRINKNIEPEQIKPFSLAIKQVNMMADDLLQHCKKLMIST